MCQIRSCRSIAMPCELWSQGTGGSSAICSPERTSLSCPSLLDALLVQYRGEDDAVTSYLVVACSSHQWHHTPFHRKAWHVYAQHAQTLLSAAPPATATHPLSRNLPNRFCSPLPLPSERDPISSVHHGGHPAEGHGQGQARAQAADGDAPYRPQLPRYHQA